MNIHQIDGLAIATENVCPPVPWRQFDWIAYLDGLGADASPYGYGRTEQDAIDDLMIRLQEDA